MPTSHLEIKNLEDFLFFTTPYPRLSTRNPSSPNKLTQPKWEWLRILYEVLHELHTIKIHNHRFNDKSVEKVFVRDYTKYVQKCPRQRTIDEKQKFQKF